MPAALEAGHLNRADAARQLRFDGPVWTRRLRAVRNGGGHDGGAGEIGGGS